MARKQDTSDPLAALRELLLELNLTTSAKRLGELLTQAETSQPAYLYPGTKNGKSRVTVR